MAIRRGKFAEVNEDKCNDALVQNLPLKGKNRRRHTCLPWAKKFDCNLLSLFLKDLQCF